MHAGGPLFTFDGDEVGLAAAGDGLGQQRLAAPRRPVEQDPRRHRDPEGAVQALEHDGEDDVLLHLLAQVRQGADVVPRDVGDGGEPLALRAGLHARHGRPEVLLRDERGLQLRLVRDHLRRVCGSGALPLTASPPSAKMRVIAHAAASRVTACRSAPTKPGVMAAISSKSTSAPKRMPLDTACTRGLTLFSK
ncbi:ribosome biogenesis ATPase rix7 [Babesia caballi]|uniref:Ribosome biogenesis ATPase rix7 n=1 Tax=Babesia caballi TaxID=5871 RepID=A0AAV4LQG2_BABCB|nr:ribosome biogenesis ATPase rix7 [Babesia caballi]